MVTTLRLFTVAVVLAGVLAGPSVRAAEEAASSESAEELAKKTQNPVADLISVPFQSNFNFDTGPNERMVYVLNVQPVIPIRLTDDWNLITRVITPIIDQPSVAPGIDNASGLGDINPSLFLSPAIYNAERPDLASDWSLRVQVQFLFPR